MTDKRLIEEAFPLKQASVASVHEKSVRHGHISTLHIWPARRPLAACRAAIIAALLPDPGTPDARKEVVRRIGGEVVEEDGKAKVKGGILQWGTEQGPDVAYFREEIRKAFGGRAPKVLDMFAGGGAIPLEAMRLGCDVTAIDYNPVAWFILKCTLEYPQKLAGRRWPLPADAGNGLLKGQDDGDIADHVRYWGNWVLDKARQDLSPYYPSLPLDPSRPEGPDNPICPTVAYLWARTVPHPDPKMAGLRVPLIKTLWLCKKPDKKRALRVVYHAEDNAFQFEVFCPQRDEDVGPGTMSPAGVQCPPRRTGETGSFIRSEYLHRCGQDGLFGAVCTAVAVDVPRSHSAAAKTPVGKDYRSPTEAELELARDCRDALEGVQGTIPDGIPDELLPVNPRVIWVQLYGLDRYHKLFTNRQLLSLATFLHHTREVRKEILKGCESQLGRSTSTRAVVEALAEAVPAYLACVMDRLLDFANCGVQWKIDVPTINHSFARFALPMTWDYAEGVPIGNSAGGYPLCLERIAVAIETSLRQLDAPPPTVRCASATDVLEPACFDAIVTDPPYYDAIPYSDVANFFYVWLRRTVGDHLGAPFERPIVPRIGELVVDRDHPLLPKARTKAAYEEGMAEAFSAASQALKPDGRMVIVFAHKQPDAWETLVAAMIRAGFVVTASWPIDTEMTSRSAAINVAALSSSVWLVCRKRPGNAGKGWYKQVQPRMRERITERLRYFWDEGVRGPDFLWSAVGPGLEAFSAYDEVRRNDGSPFTVSEFLKEVRRLTTDFALGQIVHGGTEGLDDWTRYALMHTQNFGIGGAPVGECILLSGAYGLDLGTLTGQRGILTKGKAKASATNGDEEEETEAGGSGSALRLLTWEERSRDDLGEPQASGDLHTIDVLHRLMREWASGDAARAAMYADQQGLGQNDLFWRVAQAFAEMGTLGSRERSVLEAIISWGRGRVATSTVPGLSSATKSPKKPQDQSLSLQFDAAEEPA